MDMLIFWVTLGFLVEATRQLIVKHCTPKKEPDSLREPLLNPEQMLDALGECKQGCCAHKWEEEDVQDGPQEGQEEYFLESSEGDSYLSDMPDRLSTNTDDSEEAHTEDSEEDLSELGVKIVKWEDLLGNVRSVKVVADRSASSKGKEIVEEPEEEITECDIPVRIRKDSRGKSSTKIYPEPMHPERGASLTDSDYQYMDSGQSSYHHICNGICKISDHSGVDCNFKSDMPVGAFAGECSKR